jgi:hypothetical protein
MRVPDVPPVFSNVPLLVIAFAGAVPPRMPLPVAVKVPLLISEEPLISCRVCEPSQVNVPLLVRLWVSRVSGPVSEVASTVAPMPMLVTPPDIVP